MRTYICLIADDRFAVPSLLFQEAKDDLAIRAMALAQLRANPHWQSLEVRLDDEVVFTLERADADVHG